jgi:hypothetical protein
LYVKDFSGSELAPPEGMGYPLAMNWTIHTTVPYPMLEAQETTRLLAENGVGPEIYFTANALDSITPGHAYSVSESLRSGGVRTATFHAPFEDLWPGARDEEARRLAVRRLRQAIALAPLFRPLGTSGSSPPDGPSRKWWKPPRRRASISSWKTSSTRPRSTCSA